MAARRGGRSGASPLRSMTGYGRGRARNRAAAAEVELRSVNGKAVALKLRLPPEGLELEPRIEELLRGCLQRGNVQGSVRLEILDLRPAQIHHEVLRGYLRAWRAAERTLRLERRDPSLAELLALPGAVQPHLQDARIARGVSQAALAAAAAAVAELMASREREGRRLAREIDALLRQLEQDLEQVLARLPLANAAVARRTRERIQAAWAAAGVKEPLDLTRELAVLAERADVQEEIARLRIHLDRVRALLAHGGACGRELEFLAQECHREVTTLGNKAVDAGISALVVRMKVAVAQLKEQAANVE
ncbi:MAG: YicC family protein [Planctomycetota bacterium]|nr:MAG: YicC family protein [Planctomycetota bacterium]